MFCRICGAALSDGEVQGPKCGTVTQEVQEVKNIVLCVSAKKRAIAFVLAIISFPMALLGLGGLHRFYTGNYLSGALYAITCGGLWVGVIYDIWKIYNETFKDGDGFPLYSDSEINSGFKRRPLKNEVSNIGLVAYIGGSCAAWIIILNLLSHH